MSIPQCRVDALIAFRKPSTKKDMRSFLGAMSYYRRFIPGFGQLSAVLTPSVSLRAPHQVDWTVGMEDAFGKIKDLLADHVVLCVPRQDDEMVLYTDASGDGIGACVSMQYVMVRSSPSHSSVVSSALLSVITLLRNLKVLLS